MNTWNNLSIRDKADIMKVAIRNGITNLADIKAKYNEFALGGNIYSGTQSGSQQMNQGYVYDVLPNLLAMDGVNVRVSSGYRPGSTTKSGKASRHSTHEAADIIPINGSTFADIDRVINDPNSNTSKWMMANGYGYIDETSATGTTKYWKDHNKDHSHYHIGRDSMYAKQYAAKIGGGIQNSNMQNGNYRDIAKQHIRQNESWRAKPYADGPNGWRSVGYGFNDSGFYAKYPGGISNYYAQRGGITKEEAEKELDWYLDRMEADLRRTYGSKWDSFNDNQKAAIMDTYYQRPASVGSKSAFYSAIMSGNPNAGNLLGVNGYDARNTDRRNLFSAAPMQASNQYYASQNQQSAFPEFEVSNPQAFFTPLSFYEMPVQQEMQQPLADIAEEYAKAQKAAERAERRQGLNNLMTVLSLTSPSNEGNDLYSGIMPLVSMANMSAYGGHLYDGETEPTNQMHRVNPRYLSEQVTVEGRNAKVLGADYGRNTAIVQYDDGTTEVVRPAKDFWTVPSNVVLGSKELKDNQYRTMPTNSEANAFADAWTEQTAPTVGHLIAAGLKPLDLVTPRRYVGLLDSDNKDGFLHLFNDNNRGFFIGNDPTKPFSKQFHDEHPILASIGNTALDIPAGIAAGWTIGKGWNAAAPYVEKAYNAGKNVATTFEEIMPEIWNRTADKMHFPELKGFVNKKGQYYESRFNPFGNKPLQEKILEEGYSPNLRCGEHRIIEDGGIPRYYFSKINPNTGVRETVGVNPYAGGRIFEYNATSTTPDGMDLGIASIKRSSYGYKSPGPYKMGNQFDLALTAGTASTVDKNVLKTFGAGIQRFAPKGARITGDGAPSIADRVLSNLESKHYWDALKLAARRPMLPTNNALSTDSYRYLVGYGTKYPKFSTFYDGYDTSFNNAGVKYVDDINFLKTSPETLNDIYLNLDENYPEIINGRLPHPWIKKK